MPSQDVIALNPEVYGVLPPLKRANKYNARKTLCDGHWFDSQKEANHYLLLKRLELAGEISDLRLQPKFRLQEGFVNNEGNWVKKIDYFADFSYVEAGVTIVEDVKSVATAREATFRMKFKLVQFMHRERKDIVFRIVT